MVCERQTTGSRRVQLLIDADPQSHRRRTFAGEADENGWGSDSLESAIRVGGSIVRQLHAHHMTVELRIGSQMVVGRPGHAGINHILDFLATWAPAAVPEGELSRDCEADSRSQVIVVTTSAGARRWSDELLRHQHSQLVILRFDTPTGVETKEVCEARCVQAKTRTFAESSQRRACLVIEGRDDVLMRLVRGWEKICHDGWSHS